jgi:hypothetical protein
MEGEATRKCADRARARSGGLDEVHATGPRAARLASVRAPAAEPAGGLRELTAKVDGPPDRLAHRADHPLPAAGPALRAAVDLVGQLDASPAGTFQAVEHVTVTSG